MTSVSRVSLVRTLRISAVTESEEEAVLVRFFVAMNSGDADRVAELADPHVRFVDVPGGEEVKGREAFASYCGRYMKAFPDLQFDVTNIFASSDGSMETIEGLFHGTHKGALESPGGSIPATQKAVEMPFCIVARLSDEGLLIDVREYYDAVTLMLQLGIMPEPVAAEG
jgi:steroid delta-isomerase-like uncharacterized protein